MLARLGRRDRLLGVQPNRRRDVDGVDLGIDDQLAPARVPARRADLAREALDQIGACAADGHELRLARIPERAGDALMDDIAGANKAPPNERHTWGGSDGPGGSGG